jgi:hypothetical protein
MRQSSDALASYRGSDLEKSAFILINTTRTVMKIAARRITPTFFLRHVCQSATMNEPSSTIFAGNMRKAK